MMHMDELLSILKGMVFYHNYKKYWIMINSLIDFTSGIASGIVNCLSGFFLDTVKTRMQLDPTLTSTTQALRTIIRQEGMMQLFSGVYYPLLTLPLTNSVIFTSYEYYKHIRGKEKLSFWDGAENGAVAGFIVAFVTTPADIIKVIMQSSGEKRFKHSRDCLKHIINTEGAEGLLRGNLTMIAREVPGFAAQFSVYQHAKAWYISPDHPHLSLMEALIVCPPAAVIGWIFSYPQDVIKTMLQTEAKGKYPDSKGISDGGFVACANDIYRRTGWKGFFVGLKPCLIRAAYSDSLGIMVYEKSREFMWGMRVSER